MDRLTVDRRLVPDERVVDEPHAHRRGDGLRGPAAHLRRPARAHRAAACTSSRATGRSSRSRRSRPGARSGSTTRSSTSTTTSATPRCRRPGDEDALRRMAARVFSQQLDRTKPLWELWLVEGLRKKRFALISKTHHALVDGVAGVDIATVLFDVKPVPEPAEPPRGVDRPARAVAAPSLAARGRRGAGEGPGRRRARASPRRSASPGDAAKQVAERRPRALGEVAWEFANPAPDVPLNAPIGPHRRYVWVSGDLADFKRIKSGARRDRQRRRPDRGRRLAAPLAARPRHPHRGPRAARARPGLDPRRGRRRRARQPDRRGPRAAARLRRGPGPAAADRPRGDGRDQGARRRRSAPR